MNFILNGQAYGDVAAALLDTGMNTDVLRPWKAKDGRSYISTTNEKGERVATPVGNAATLRKDEWKILDTAIIRAAKERLRVVADLRSRGLTYNIPNGMSKTVLETERVSDITPATISMDPARQSEQDRPQYDLTNLPLPVIHKDFYFNIRQIATSRHSGSSIDTTTAELAGRRVSEEAEKLALGITDSFSYGGGTIYGMTNFPSRITRVVRDPANSGTDPEDIVDDILNMRQDSIDSLHYGPWVLYNSPYWDRFLDKDYSTQKGDNTLRQRIMMIRGVEDIRTADYLTGKQLILVQQTSDVIREVIGMDITTVQWETMGGMRVHFKVMAIMVPQLRADINGNTGIVHGTAA